MAKKHFIFNNPPFSFLAEHLARDADFLDIARQILAVKDGIYAQLTTQLEKSDKFLGRDELRELVEELFDEGGSDLASAIYYLGSIVHDSEMDASAAMDLLAEAIVNNADSLEPAQRTLLVERIRQLVVEPVGIAKQFKARSLATALGAELDSFRIICDIRPIFDSQRQKIDGAIPLTIMQLEYTKPGDESHVVEIRMTEKQIAKLGERLADAKLKLEMIRDLLKQQSLQTPKLESSILEENK